MSKPLVLITGPTGFVGAHVFRALLTNGYRVRGTIRRESGADFLRKQYPDQTRDMDFIVVPDIQAVGALDAAASDVDYICHVASPYFMSTTDPIKELVEPAVNGTKNVVASALKSKTLKRLTIMSSFASVNDIFKAPRPGYTYTEADWDPITEEQAKKDGFMGYHASKTFAERAAWDMWKEAKPSWDLVTFCPPMIYGPPIHEVHPEKGIDGLNTSVSKLMQGITGQDPAFKPKVASPGLPAWVDVRDVAKAHLASLGLPKGSSERFLLCSSLAFFEDGLGGLRAKGVKGLGEPGEKCDQSKFYGVDTSKARKLLGFDPIPLDKTIDDVWERMTELGMI
jgi:nucleoside-diphosphate-sugar epimerase